MKIHIHDPGSKNLTISLPNAMLFSPTLLNLFVKVGVLHSDHKIPDIPKDTLRQICAVIKDYSKSHGSWELVHVESASGATVIITM